MRIRRLEWKHQENDKDRLDEAELDFQSLCRSFEDSDGDTPRRLPSPLFDPALAIPAHRSPSPTFPSMDAVHGDEQETAGDRPINGAETCKDATGGDVFDGGERPRGMPLKDLMIDGKDDAWWAAEYARRDAAYPREERGRQACVRYYQRSGS